MREPLVGFAVGGAVLWFLLSFLLAPGQPALPKASLQADLTASLGREPTEEELEGRLAAFAEEQALVELALKLGLDQGDPVVRRRLAQRMRQLLEASVPEPTEQQLTDYFAENRSRYASAEVLVARIEPHEGVSPHPVDQEGTAAQLSSRFGEEAVNALLSGKEQTARYRLQLIERRQPKTTLDAVRAAVKADWSREARNAAVAKALP